MHIDRNARCVTIPVSHYKRDDARRRRYRRRSQSSPLPSKSSKNSPSSTTSTQPRRSTGSLAFLDESSSPLSPLSTGRQPSALLPLSRSPRDVHRAIFRAFFLEHQALSLSLLRLARSHRRFYLIAHGFPVSPPPPCPARADPLG